MVIGNGVPFCGALIVPNAAALEKRLFERGLVPGAPMHASEQARALVQSEIDAVNRGLAKWEQVKRFQLLSEPWTIEDGALTPTLKVKRRVIQERYGTLIEAMYA